MLTGPVGQLPVFHYIYGQKLINQMVLRTLFSDSMYEWRFLPVSTAYVVM